MGVKIKQHTSTVTLPGSELHDEPIHVTVNRNMPLSVAADVDSGDVDRIIRALNQIVVEHDVEAEDGTPLPPSDWGIELATEFVAALRTDTAPKV